MPTVYENKTYAIKKIKEGGIDRFCITFKNEVLCKYNNTYSDTLDMIRDIVYFEVTDKVIGRNQKNREERFLRELFSV